MDIIFQKNGLNIKMVPANIWCFGFSLYKKKNCFFGFSPYKYRIFGFGPWYFVLILVKSFHIEIGPYNIHFSPHFEGLKSNILHITRQI